MGRIEEIYNKAKFIIDNNLKNEREQNILYMKYLNI